MAERWILRGERAAFEALRPHLEAARAADQGEHGVLPLGATRCVYKASPLRGMPTLRHGLRRTVLRIPPPRVAEFDNLAWLRARGFGAPRPVTAGALVVGGLPRFQFLATQLESDARTFRELLEKGPVAQRGPALALLASEVARLHATGFVHRDLFPRNVLWCASPTRVLFLDCWRGGPGPGLRGPAHDLACWMVDGASLLVEDETRAFLERYIAERERLGAPVRPGPFLGRVARARRGLVRRLLARPARLGGRPAPPVEWEPPSPGAGGLGSDPSRAT